MENKFNIALLPRSEKKVVIEYSQFLSSIADQYILGERSLPHVTLYQFQANESDIESIWNDVCNNLSQKSIELLFEKFSCITFDKTIFWASLLPDNCDRLMQMHSIVADILNQPVKPNYDPHMTLISTKDSSYENLVDQLSKRYTPIKDLFVLSIGRSDDIGQFTEMIYSC